MSPLIEDGSLVLVRKQLISALKPAAGDLVVFPSPIDGVLNIKKCAAVNNGAVFVIGINLPGSTDSRHFGRIDVTDLSGVVLLY